MLLKRERCLEKIRPFYDLDIISNALDTKDSTANLLIGE